MYVCLEMYILGYCLHMWLGYVKISQNWGQGCEMKVKSIHVGLTLSYQFCPRVAKSIPCGLNKFNS